MAQTSAATDPVALVRRASQNELRSSNSGHPYRYTLRKSDTSEAKAKITTKEIIETKDGDVARLVAVDDKPLDQEAMSNEVDRLNKLAADPKIQEHRHQKEKEDSGRADEMVRLLPDAFLYTLVGTVDGPNGPCYRLTFKPNPNFNPPDREAEVYHGMTGELWIDKTQERMVKLDAHLIEDVDFGWGILGRLYKGGSILVEQSDVGDHHWETMRLKLDLTGKILMLKSLTIRTLEEASGFQPVAPDTGYQQAIQTLLKEPSAPAATSGQGH